jgi:hypothetical protein
MNKRTCNSTISRLRLSVQKSTCGVAGLAVRLGRSSAKAIPDSWWIGREHN